MQLARRQMRTGAIAAFIYALLLVISLFIRQHETAVVIGIYVFISVLLLFGFGVIKGSRVASVLLLLFSILSFSIRLYFVYTTRTAYFLPVLFIAGAVLFCFVLGVRGTFRYHKLTQSSAKEYGLSHYLVRGTFAIAGICALLLVVALVILGFFIEQGMVPSYKVSPGYEVSEKNYQWLVDNGIINDGELIEYFYSEGLFSIHDEGNLLTSNRLVSYERIDGELAVYEASMDELQDYQFYQSDSFFDDSWLDVTTFREAEPLPGETPDDSVIEYESFSLLLSNTEGGDIQLVKSLKEKLVALGWFPVTEVLPREKVPADYIGWMREQNILEDYENLLYFYSAGRHSIAEDGNILTDKRLISYYQDENEEGGYMSILSVPYSDVVNYEITVPGTEVSDTRVYFHTVENGFFIYLSPKNRGDDAFIDELVRRADIQPQHLLEANKEE